MVLCHFLRNSRGRLLLAFKPLVGFFDITMEIDPFNEVDNLVLAELAYTDFGGIVPGLNQKGQWITIREAHDRFFSMYSEEEIMAKNSTTKVAPFLMHKMVASARFQNLRLMNYVNEIDEENQTQFSVLSFLVIMLGPHPNKTQG